MLSASLPVVIAGIVAYIAWQQFAVNRRQHRLALFEKRLVVFNSTMKMISSVVQAANADLTQCFQFIRDTRDHEFLFGSEIGEFINEVYRKAVGTTRTCPDGTGWRSATGPDYGMVRWAERRGEEDIFEVHGL